MKTVEMIVSVVICVVLFAALLLPTIASSSETLYTTVDYNNNYSESQISLSPIDVSTSNTITADSTGITTNNGTIPIWSDDTSYASVIFITERMFVVMGGDGTITVRSVNDSNVSATTFTAVVSAGEFTYSIDEGDAVTLAYSSGYIADPKGDYTSVYLNSSPYFKDKLAQGRLDSSLYTYIDGNAYSNGNATTMTVVSSDVEGTEGEVKQLTQIKYTSSKGLNSQVVVPKVVQYTYTDSPEVVALLNVIPILIIAGLVIFVAYTIARRGE